MDAAQRLHQRILRRVKQGVEEDIDALLNEDPSIKKGVKAVDILDNVLLPAMKEVGDKFGAGELIRCAAERGGDEKERGYLENFLRKAGPARVNWCWRRYGDARHWQNLVKTILSNNGYEVVDLGNRFSRDDHLTG